MLSCGSMLGPLVCLLLIVPNSKQQALHYLVKRQTNGSAPTFSQSSYTFTAPSCNAGTSVGTIFASSSSTGVQTGYTVDPSSTSGYYVIIGYLTGQITLSTNAASSFTFNVRATNSFGTAAVPVTVTCSGATTSGLGTVSCPFPNGTCTTTGFTSPYTNTPLAPLPNTYPSNTVPTYPYNPAYTPSPYTVPYNSVPYGYAMTSALTPTYPYTGAYPSYSSTGSTYPYAAGPTTPCSTTSTYPPAFGTVTPQPQYFTVTNCYAGGYVGQVCYPGATAYLIGGSTGQFTVNPKTGIITLVNPLYGGTYPASVQAYNNAGSSIPISVMITASCGSFG